MRLFNKAIFLAAAITLTLPALGQSLDEAVNAYERGDYATVLENVRPLAEQGHAAAQYNLGVMYANGEGVSRNPVMAYVLWNLAAAQGHDGGRTNRDIVAAMLASDQLAEGQRMATEWREGTPLPYFKDFSTWP